MAAQLGVSDILATLGLDTALADFEIQSFKKRSGTNYAKRTSRMGDVLDEGVLDTIEEYDLSLIINKYDAASATQVILGGVGYGDPGSEIVVTKVGVRQVNNGNPTLSLTVHRHTVKVDGAAHHERAYTVVLPLLGWGVNALLSVTGTIPDVVASANFDASVDHKDELNREGTKWLLGASTNCQLAETIQLTQGVATITLVSGWKADPTESDELNTDYANLTLKHHKSQAPDA